MTFNRQRRRKVFDVETHEQILVAAWLRQMGIFFTIAPAGLRLPPSVGKRLKDMGYRAGSPDLLIFESGKSHWTTDYHGLFIEMKRPALPQFGITAGVQSQEQKTFHAIADRRGYKYIVCWGYEEAKMEICKYLGIKDGEKWSNIEPF